jgi:twitching motility protein PilT
MARRHRSQSGRLTAAAPMTAPAQAPATVNLRVLLEEMIERDASDLHITAGERPKLRIDGEISNSNIESAMSPKDTMQLAYSVLTEN